MAGKKPTVEILTTFKLSEASKKQLRASIKKALTLSSRDTKKILENLNSGLEAAAETFRKSMKTEIDAVSRHMKKAFEGSGFSFGGGGTSGTRGTPSGTREAPPPRYSSYRGDTSIDSTTGWSAAAWRARQRRGSLLEGTTAAGGWTEQDWRNRGRGAATTGPVGTYRVTTPTLRERMGATGDAIGRLGARASAVRFGARRWANRGVWAAMNAQQGASLLGGLGAPNLSGGIGAGMSSYQQHRANRAPLPEDATRMQTAMGNLSSLGAGLKGGIMSMITGFLTTAIQVAERTSESRIRAIDAGAAYTPSGPDAGGMRIRRYNKKTKKWKSVYQGLGFDINEQSALGMQMAGATGTTTRESLRSTLLAQRLGGNAGGFTGLVGAMAQTGAGVGNTQKILSRVIGSAIDQGLKKGRWRELFAGFKQIAQTIPLGFRYNQKVASSIQGLIVNMTGGSKSPLGGIRSLRAAQSLNQAVSGGGGGGMGQTLGLLAAGMGQGGMGYFEAMQEMQKGIFSGEKGDTSGKDRLKKWIETIKTHFGTGGMGKMVLSKMTKGTIPMELAGKFLKGDWDDDYEKLKSNRQLQGLAVGKGSGMSRAGGWRRAQLVNQAAQVKVANALRPAIVTLRTTLAKTATKLFEKGGIINSLITTVANGVSYFVGLLKTAVPRINWLYNTVMAKISLWGRAGFRKKAAHFYKQFTKKPTKKKTKKKP